MGVTIAELAPTAQLLVTLNYDPLTAALTGRLADGTVLTPQTVRRLSCDAGILPAVFNSDNQPINLGTTTRNISPALRALLVARDAHCRGCGASHHFCQAHHIRHWAAGGATDLDNLVLLCNRCHHLVHEGGHHIHRQPDGTYTLTRTRNGSSGGGDRNRDRAGSGNNNRSGAPKHRNSGSNARGGAPGGEYAPPRRPGGDEGTAPKPREAASKRQGPTPTAATTATAPGGPDSGGDAATATIRTPPPDPNKTPRRPYRNPIASNSIAAARQAINNSPIARLDIFNNCT